MKVVAISDTHGKHRLFDIPDGDMFIHAGDFTNVGELDQVEDFNKWLGELPHTYKIVIAGNHDLSLERSPEITEPMLTNCIYLKDEGITLDNKTIWGSPWTPFFHSDFWVFHKKGYLEQAKHWSRVPENLDILVTHGPPNRVLDLTMEGENAGDMALAHRLFELDFPPKFHLFGHIHEGYGKSMRVYKQNDWAGSTVRHANVSALDRMYKPRENPAIEFEV